MNSDIYKTITSDELDALLDAQERQSPWVTLREALLWWVKCRYWHVVFFVVPLLNRFSPIRRYRMRELRREMDEAKAKR